MLRMISNALITPKTYVTSALRSLIKDERGLSGVVVAILLILVAVLAVIIIWVFLGDWLNDMWEQITSQSDSIS